MINDIKAIILYNILLLQENYRGKKDKKMQNNRNILNKWFQDNIKAFAMKQIAGPLLVEPLNLKNTDQVQQYIENNIQLNVPSYVGVIIKYFNVIVDQGLQNQFLNNIVRYMYCYNQEVELSKIGQYNIQKKIRTSFVACLLYSFFNKFLYDQNEAMKFNNFFDIWNETFPDHPVTQRRKNIFQMKKNLNNSQQPSSETETLKFEDNYVDLMPSIFGQAEESYQDVTLFDQQQPSNENPNFYQCTNSYSKFEEYTIAEIPELVEQNDEIQENQVQQIQPAQENQECTDFVQDNTNNLLFENQENCLMSNQQIQEQNQMISTEYYQGFCPNLFSNDFGYPEEDQNIINYYPYYQQRIMDSAQYRYYSSQN